MLAEPAPCPEPVRADVDRVHSARDEAGLCECVSDTAAARPAQETLIDRFVRARRGVVERAGQLGADELGDRGYRAQFARPISFISSYGKRSEEALAELRTSFLN
jgi:hypothetical protein